MFVAVRNRRHDQVDGPAILAHHLALDILEVTFADQLLQPPVRVGFSIGLAEEIGNRAAQNLVARETEFLQPVIRHCDDQAVAIDRMQHSRRRPIQRSILEIRFRLVGELGVDRNGPQELTFPVVLDECVREAIDNFAITGDQSDRLVFELAGAAQCRAQFLFDALGTLRRRKLLGSVPHHLVAGVAEAFEHRVVDVEENTLVGDRGRHHRRLAKQPLIVVLGDHRSIIYEIP